MSPDQYPVQAPLKEDGPVPGERRSFGWSMATLAVGVIALAAAVMLHLSIDEAKQQPKAAAEEVERIEGGIRLKWKSVEAHFGGRPVKRAEPKVEAKPDERADPVEQRRRYRMITAAIALVGLAVGPLAFWRESAYALSGPGMAFCFVALTWQYIIAGIAMGVAVVVILLILSAIT